MISDSEALKIANGNTDAARFLVAFVSFCHLLDDVVDKDQPVTDERLARTSLDMFSECLFNPFVRQNAVLLWPLIVVGFNAWIDANRWEVEGRNRDADILKGVYHEVCWFTAWLCGGWDHLKSLTKEHRQYDFD